MKRIILIICSFLVVLIVQQNNAQHSNRIIEIIDYVSKILEISANRISRSSLNPDVDLTVDEILIKYNYPVEKHQVSTEDGYILTLHRIPNGPNSFNNTKRKPAAAVFLKHGYLTTSMDWLLLGPGKSIGMVLADLGYDVWLGNSRGNRYSNKHQILDTSVNSIDYWNFSYHEKGYYDLAASIDYIISTTRNDKITFIGHSQGTIEGLVLASSRPEYNEKLNLMVMLSPVAYREHIISPPMLILYKHLNKLENILKSLNIYGYPYNSFVPNLGKVFCNNDSLFLYACIEFFQMFCGYDSPQFNKSMLAMITSNAPSGGSLKELIHHGQDIASGDFKQYDYGNRNEIFYNSPAPPHYDMSKVTAPVAAYYAANDYFATYPDVSRLLKQIRNIKVSHLVRYDLFNHFDFLIAKDARKILYNKIFKEIAKYNY